MDESNPYAPPASPLIPRPADRVERPPLVTTAVRLLYGSVALGLIALLTLEPTGGVNRGMASPLTVVLGLVPFAVLVSLLAQGRRWAAWLVSAWILVGLPMTLPVLATLWPWYVEHPYSFLVVVTQTGLQASALVLLARSQSRKWFHAKKAERAAV